MNAVHVAIHSFSDVSINLSSYKSISISLLVLKCIYWGFISELLLSLIKGGHYNFYGGKPASEINRTCNIKGICSGK